MELSHWSARMNESSLTCGLHAQNASRLVIPHYYTSRGKGLKVEGILFLHELPRDEINAHARRNRKEEI